MIWWVALKRIHWEKIFWESKDSICVGDWPSAHCKHVSSIIVLRKNHHSSVVEKPKQATLLQIYWPKSVDKKADKNALVVVVV